MIKVKAKFVGTTSLTYVSGNIYNISLRPQVDSYWINQATTQSICKYDSYNAFRRNWEIQYQDHDCVQGDISGPEFQEIRTQLHINARNIKLNQLIQ